MAITVPQAKGNDFTASSSSFSVQFTSNIAAGSVVAFGYMWDANASGTPTVSDGHGSTPTDSGGVGTTSATKSRFGAFLNPNTTGVALTVTVTFPGPTNPTFGDLFIWEVDGLTSPSFDKKIVNNGASGNPTSGSSGTLAASAEAILGYIVTDGSSTINSMAFSGLTTVQDGQTTTTQSLGGHAIAASNAATTETATASVNWSTWLVSFQSSSAAVTDTLGNQIFRIQPRRYY